MAIDVEKVLGYKFEPHTFTYTSKDAILYALGIGAGRDPLDKNELQFVYELFSGGFKVFPTYSVNFAFEFLPQIHTLPGLDFHPMMLVHGEQEFVLKSTVLPSAGSMTSYAIITKVYDKRSGIVLIIEVETKDENGDAVVYNEYSIFIRGIGGFGGERGPAAKRISPPDRAPDAVEEHKTRPDQALLYRLAGDHNPLHADPELAAQGGFERPILHGLCTFGFAARAVLKNFCGYDVRKFRGMRTRFAKPIFPGETLVTEMWQVDNQVILQTKVAERGEFILTHAAVEIV